MRRFGTVSLKKLTQVLASHQMFMQSIMAVLIVLSVLELGISISCAVLGIKALKSSENTGNQVDSAKIISVLLNLLFFQDR